MGTPLRYPKALLDLGRGKGKKFGVEKMKKLKLREWEDKMPRPNDLSKDRSF